MQRCGAIRHVRTPSQRARFAPDGAKKTEAERPENAGLVDVRNLVLGAQGTLTASVTVEFEVTLAPVITVRLERLRAGLR